MPTLLNPCLYCRDVDGLRKGAEHVLQAAFGTNLTIPDEVCDACNGKVFSPMDGELARYVRVYAYWDHPDADRTRTILQDGHTLWLKDGVWLSIRLDKTAKPIVFSQIVFLDDGKVHVSLDPSTIKVDRAAAEVQRYVSDLSKPEQLKIKGHVAGLRNDGGPEVQPAIIWTAPETYLLRAATEEVLGKLRAKVMEGTALAGMRQVDQPTVVSSPVQAEAKIEINIGSVERAIAKSALNLLCALLGPTIARDPRFDPIRNFAYTGDVGLHKFVTLIHGDDAESESGQPAATNDFAGKFCVAGHHTMTLLDVQGTPVVLLCLYGRPFATIRLTLEREPGLLTSAVTTAVLFDYQTGKTTKIRLVDDPIAFASKFSLMPPGTSLVDDESHDD